MTTAEALIARGETLWIGDGTYNSVIFNVATSSTTLITVKKATVAAHGVATGWSDSMGDGQAAFVNWEIASSYWVFDGVSGSGPTNTGSGLRGFQLNQTTANGIDISPGKAADNHITIKHVAIVGNLTQGSVGIRAVPSSGTITNLDISYMFFNGIGNCPLLWVPVGDSIIEYNYFGTFTGDPEHHSELISLWGGGSVGNVTFRYNIVTHIDSTGGIMFDNSGNPTSFLYVYGNVFYRPSGDSWDGNNGIIGGWTGGGGEELHNVLVYNNTFINTTVPVLGEAPTTNSGNIARNNLFYNCDDAGGGNSVWDTITHNHFISTTTIGTSTSSSVGDPFVAYTSYNFHLTADTTAWTTLGSPYATDPDGVARTSSRGAYQYVSGEATAGGASSRNVTSRGSTSR